MIGGEGYGIIPLYLTVVFMVGSWVRGLFADQVSSIIYDDMHNVDALVVLCETIYGSRIAGDYPMEEATFRKLVRIYRDPTLLLKLTRRRDLTKQKQD